MAADMGRPPTAPKEDRAPVQNDRPPTQRPGAWLGGFAPGQAVRVYQPGTALKIPAGAVLLLQMHYTANGKAAADRTRIGIKYASAPPKTEVRVVALANQNFVLKAGTPDTRVDAEVTLNQDVTLWSVPGRGACRLHPPPPDRGSAPAEAPGLRRRGGDRPRCMSPKRPEIRRRTRPRRAQTPRVSPAMASSHERARVSPPARSVLPGARTTGARFEGRSSSLATNSSPVNSQRNSCALRRL
jgi:hypothetical protein